MSLLCGQEPNRNYVVNLPSLCQNMDPWPNQFESPPELESPSYQIFSPHFSELQGSNGVYYYPRIRASCAIRPRRNSMPHPLIVPTLPSVMARPPSSCDSISQPLEPDPLSPYNIEDWKIKLHHIATFKSKHCELYPAPHAWKRCPGNHENELARRNPFKFTYTFAFCHRFDRASRDWECSKGASCRFSHCKEEELFHPLKYKTVLCKDYESSGTCSREHNCAFIHDDPSPLVGRDGLKSILMFLTDLAKPKRGEHIVNLSHDDKKELISLIRGYSAIDIYDNRNSNDIISVDWARQSMSNPKAYIAIWLRCHYDRVYAFFKEKYSNFDNIPFETFIFTKLETIYKGTTI